MLSRLLALLGFKRFNVLLRYFTACKSLKATGRPNSLARKNNGRKGPHQTYRILMDLFWQHFTVLKLWKLKTRVLLFPSGSQGHVVGAILTAPKVACTCTDTPFLLNQIKWNLSPFLLQGITSASLKNIYTCKREKKNKPQNKRNRLIKLTPGVAELELFFILE